MNNQIEQIKAEIKNRLNWKSKIRTSYYMGCSDELRELRSFIDTLPDEPSENSEQLASEDLEKAAENWCKENNKGIALCADGKSHYLAEGMDAFIAGAQWQKEQFMEILDKWEEHAIRGMKTGATAYHQGKIALITDLRYWLNKED